MASVNGDGPGLYDLAKKQAQESQEQAQADALALLVLPGVECLGRDWLRFVEYMEGASGQTALTWMVDAFALRDLISFMDRVHMTINAGVSGPDDPIIVACPGWLVEDRIVRDLNAPQLTLVDGTEHVTTRDVPSVLGVIFGQLGIDWVVTDR